MYNQLSVGVNFGARMRSTFPVEELPGFSEVCRPFSELTRVYPQKILYLSKYKPDRDAEESLIIHLSMQKALKHSKDAVYYDGSNIVISNWNKLRQRLSESELAKYFAKRLKIMVIENIYTASQDKLLDRIRIVKEKYAINRAKATSLQERGISGAAKCYNGIAKRNMMQVQTLEENLRAMQESYAKKYKEIADGDVELIESFML